MPSREEFTAAFEELVTGREEFTAAFGSSGSRGYKIQCGRTDSDALEGYALGDGVWEEQELWDGCVEIIDAASGLETWKDRETSTQNFDNAGAMEFVSAILSTLGFEWI